MRIAKPLLIAGFFFFTFFAGRASKQTEQVYKTFEVATHTIVKREPQVVRSISEKLVYAPREPEFTAVAPDGGRETLRSFCQQLAEGAGELVTPTPNNDVGTSESDVAAPAPLSTTQPVMELVRSGQFRPPLLWGRSNLELFSVGSDGSLRHRSWQVAGRWQLLTSEQGLEVRSSRWWWIGEGLRIGLPLAAGYALGKTF